MSEDILERAKAEYEIADDDIIDLLGELIAEVERLRSVYLAYSQRHDRIFQKVIKRNKAQRTRIKELEAEVERLRSANPFDVDVSVAMRVSDDHFVYGSGESTKILQELCDGITSMKVRIEELEAEKERLGAAFLEEYQRGAVMLSPNAAQEALERIRSGEQ